MAFQGKREEAEQLCKRSLAIRQNILCADHPVVVELLDSWAETLHLQVTAVFGFGFPGGFDRLVDGMKYENTW